MWYQLILNIIFHHFSNFESYVPILVFQAKELPTFKDNDFVKDGETIYIGDDAKDTLIDTLTADVEVCVRFIPTSPSHFAPYGCVYIG